ncbi:unnamed protein product [Phytophthora lilii]|uniref:Unnamed protein product n=1 Tax=Phytophthora lilii TaxID=2077276 RepID=A0A9W6YLU4_9STRA|nr:unnamed protein product [Phytophthora lilii]
MASEYGTVNVVDIDTDKYVGHLLQEIAEKLKYGGKASDLQLFLAKKKDGGWLDGIGLAGVTLDEAGAPVSPTRLQEDGSVAVDK